MLWPLLGMSLYMNFRSGHLVEGKKGELTQESRNPGFKCSGI